MKRNLFNELKEGLAALESARKGKITLRQHVVEKKPVPTITPQELLSLREKLHLSRAVFARYLRTNERTLENWEQGRASPNAQAAILIRMVERLSSIRPPVDRHKSDALASPGSSLANYHC